MPEFDFLGAAQEQVAPTQAPPSEPVTEPTVTVPSSFDFLQAAQETQEPPVEKQLFDTVRIGQDAKIVPQEARKTLEAARKFDVDNGAAKHLVNEAAIDSIWEDTKSASQTAPKLTQWAVQDPTNSAAIRENFKKHVERERIMGNLNYLERSTADFLSGLNGMVAGVVYGDRWLKSRLDESVGELFPGTFLDRPVKAPEESSVYKFFKENRDTFRTDPASASLQDVWRLGDPTVMLPWVASQTASQLPQALPSMLLGPAGLIPMFTSTFGQNLEESDETKASNWAKLVDASFSATAEVALEKFTLGSQVKLEGTLRKVLGDKKFVEVMKKAADSIKEMGGEIGKLYAKEIGGEMATEYLQSGSDYLTGIDADAMKGVGWKMAQAGIVAGTMTGTTRSPIIVAKALKSATSKYNTMQQQKAYDKLTSSDMRTEMETEAPSVAKTLFQQQLDKKSMLIPVEKFNTILTEQGLDPAEVAKELGAEQSYSQAKTGSDVRVDTASWIVKFGGTPTATAFRDHFTWNPMTRTAEEQKTDNEVEAEETIEPESEAMQGVESQLAAVLPKKSHVKLFSTLISSWAETRAKRLGVKVEDVIGKANLKIEKVTGVDPSRFLEGMTAHPQLGKSMPEKETALKFSERINTPEFDAEYAAQNKNVISPARIQNYSEEYKNDPAEHFFATIDVAKKKALRMFKERLANVPQRHVCINSGAQTSGSEDVLTGKKGSRIAKDGLVLDIPMTSFVEADAIIQAAVSAGNKVQVVYTYKDLAIAASEHRREVVNGKPLYPVDQFTLDHINTYKTAVALAEKYGENPDPNVNIEIQVYRGGLPQEATLDELRELRYGFPEETDSAIFERKRKIVGGILRDAERQALQKREWAARGDRPSGPGGTGVPEEGAETSWDTYGINSLEEAAEAAERAASAGLADRKKKPPKKPLTQKGRVIQGAYQTKDGKSFIYLFADSNFSTLIHELMHFFHHEAILDYQALAQVPEDQLSPADIRFKQDMDSLAKDMGASSFLDMKEEHMEKLARAFETYAAEGKAPSVKLQNAFHTFKQWMLAIYRRIQEIGSPINDNTRAVFDRWLATSEEIAEVQAEANPLGPSILSNVMLPTKAAKALSDAIAKAATTAELRLAEKTQMAYVRSFNRDQKELRAEIRSQVQEEADANGTYQRMDKLAKMPPDSRIGKEFLDAELLKRLPKDIVSEQGFDPEVIANILGYNTAMDMMQDFTTATPKEQFIEQETERRYKELGHTVIQPSEQLRDIAREIVNSDEKDKVYAEELRILATEDLSSVRSVVRNITATSTGTQGMLSDAAKFVEAIPTDKLNPDEFLTEERKAREEAGKLFAKGDIESSIIKAQEAKILAARYQQAVKAKTSAMVKEARGSFSMKSDKDISDQADKILGQIPFNELDPASFVTAERKARKEAFTQLLKGDWEGSRKSVENARLFATAFAKASREQLKTIKNNIRLVTSKPKATDQLLADADNIIESMRVDELNPAEFIRAERNARALAGKLLTQGDLEGCFQAVQDSRLHAMCYRKATQARRLVDQSKKMFKNVLKYSPSDSKRRDADLVMAAKAVLAKWGLGRKGQNPFEYMQKLNTYNPAMYQLILSFVVNKAPAERVASENLTVFEMPINDFRKLTEAVGALWSMSDKMHEVELSGRKLRIEDLTKKASEIIQRITPEDKRKFTEGKTDKDRLRDKVTSAIAKNTSMRTLCKWLDGKAGGFFYETLFLPVEDGVLNHLENFSRGTKGLAQLVEPKLLAFEDGRTIEAPELVCMNKSSKEYGKPMRFRSTLHLVEYASHYFGNKSNREKMLAGQGWAIIDPETGVLDTTKADAFFKRMLNEGVLTQEHLEVMQTLGKAFGKILPKMQEAKHKNDGYYMTEIPLVPFEAAGKTWEGWYLPVIYDPTAPENAEIGKSEEGMKVSEDLATMRVQDSFNLMAPCKGLDGMTFARTGYTGPLETNMALYLSALDKCYRYAYISPAVTEVSKIVANKDFAFALDSYNTSVIKNIIKPFLRSAITQSSETQVSNGASVARYTKEATAMLYMMGNLTNAAIQLTGFMPGLAITSVKKSMGSGFFTTNYLMRVGAYKGLSALGGQRVRTALHGIVSNKGLTPDRINQLSKFMRVLSDNSAQEREEFLSNALKGKGSFTRLQTFMRANMYFMQSFTQNITNNTLWRAKFEQELERDPDMERAIMLADNAVADSQGTPFTHDVTSWEQGGAWWRAFGMFGRYWATQMNFIMSEIALPFRDNPKKREAFARASYVAFIGVVATSIVTDALMAIRMRDDEDKEGKTDWSWETLLRRAIYSPLNYSTGLLPMGVRPVVQFAFKSFGKEAIAPSDKRTLGGDRVQFTPFISLIERLTRSVKKDISDIKQGRPVEKMKVTKDLADIATLATRIPFGPAVRQTEWAVNRLTGAKK